MGKRDAIVGRYFEDNDRFADLINGFVFQGEQVVTGEDVKEKDSKVTGILGKLRDRFIVQKYRDAVRKVILGTNFMIVGLENQDNVHYAMPVRIMLEDAAAYDEQMRRVQKRHRRRRDLQGAEFLGGFRKEDRVHGVFTICLYYGKDPYDGPTDLYQMIEFGQLSDRLRGMVNNYRIHVLEVRSFQDADQFQTDLREVFGFIQRSGDKNEAWRFTEENQDKFKQLDEDAFDVITVLTGSAELSEKKERYQEEGGTVNMCEAIQGMIEDGVERGRLEGRLEGRKQSLIESCKDFGLTKDETLSRVMEKLSLSLDEAESCIEQYWK